uniref:Zinc-ribbon domain-containing protein n=1 Tax=mine drainage metagenome TaxID=410659 RepID=E6Q0Q3_9ZZZZ
MRDCISCNATLPDDAAFCSLCGHSQNRVDDVDAESSVGGASRQAWFFNPEAGRAVAATAYAAQGVVSTLGIEKTLALIGGLFAVVGCVTPVISANGPPSAAAFMAQYSSPSLFRLGMPGVLVLVLAIVLGVAPFLLRPSRAITFAGIGLSAIVLTNLLSAWFLVATLQYTFQSFQSAQVMAQSSPFGAGGVGVDVGAGFYLTLVGFVLLFSSYVRSASA